MKYDLKAIMSRAWRIFRKLGVSFSEALHRAWRCEKVAPINAARIECAKAEAGVTEEVNTWAGWKDQGLEVIHGMKALFSAVLIYASHGDGMTYRASFFSRSQVA